MKTHLSGRTLFLMITGVILSACSTAEDQEMALESRITVDGSTLVSGGFPQGSITMAPELTYAGGETFILYDVARCEIHLYVEADQDKRVHRLYWLQFEGYLPSIIPRSYDYSDDPYRTQIGGHEFFDSVRYFNISAARQDWQEGSDIMHVLRLLEREGYHLDDDIMRIRLVRLDESKTQELMIIYMEDLARHGLSISDFEKADGARKWQEAYEAMRTRALAGMTMVME